MIVAIQAAPKTPARSGLGRVEMMIGLGVAIASGILQPKASSPDPFAPIRRMSQAERIAFFS